MHGDYWLVSGVISPNYPAAMKTVLSEAGGGGGRERSLCSIKWELVIPSPVIPKMMEEPQTALLTLLGLISVAY